MIVRAVLAGMVALSAAIGLSACVERPISLSYVPPSPSAAIPGAEKVKLDVVAVDKRAQFMDRVGTANGARIIADGDVKELVRSAIERELTARGFSVAAGGLVVTVELQNFYINYTFSSSADVAFSIRVRGNSGAGPSLFSHYYQSTSKTHGTFESAKAGSKACLEEALAGAVKQVMDDRNLQAALLSAAASPPAPSGLPRSAR